MNNPSQIEVNKVVRILKQDGPLKYTVRIFKADDSVIEFQTDKGVKTDWDAEDRHLWITENAYPAGRICRYEQGMVILHEENPKP